MRKGVVIAGAVLLLVGGVLSDLPVPNQSVASDTYSAMTGPVFEFPGPFDFINPSIGYAASWSSSSGSSINVSALDCGSDSSCATHSTISNGSGATGSLSWAGTKGHYYALIVSNSATVKITASLPVAAGVVGFILLVFGIVVLILGLVPKSGTPAPQDPPSPAPKRQPPA